VQAQTAPVPTTITNTYAAKFICGVQPNASLKAVPDAQAGHYSTKINVHNNTGIDIKFRKKVIQLKGGQVPTPPAFAIFESLKSDYAMEVVCRDKRSASRPRPLSLKSTYAVSLTRKKSPALSRPPAR